MSWWDAAWFSFGWCLGWAFILSALVWAGRNKDRILAWYIRRSLPPGNSPRLRYQPPPPPE